MNYFGINLYKLQLNLTSAQDIYALLPYRCQYLYIKTTGLYKMLRPLLLSPCQQFCEQGEGVYV